MGEQPVRTSSTGDIPVTSAPAVDIYTAMANARLCQQGYHAWVPWLDLGNGLWLTWCARQGCEHKEQYDHG